MTDEAVRLVLTAKSKERGVEEFAFFEFSLRLIPFRDLDSYEKKAAARWSFFRSDDVLYGRT